MAVRKVRYIGGCCDDVYTIGEIYDVFAEWHGDYWVNIYDGDWSLMDKTECEIVKADDEDYDYYYRSIADIGLFADENIEIVQEQFRKANSCQELADIYAPLYNSYEFEKEEFNDFKDIFEEDADRTELHKYEEKIEQWADLYKECEKALIMRAKGEGLFYEKDDVEVGIILQLEDFMNKYGYYIKDGWWRHIEDAADVVTSDSEKRVNYEKHWCPVCKKTIFDRWWSCEICKECGWKDDGFQYDRHDYINGANTMSVNEARMAYAEGGKDRIFNDLPYSDEEE